MSLGGLCDVYFESAGGVECFNFIASVYFDNLGILEKIKTP